MMRRAHQTPPSVCVKTPRAPGADENIRFDPKKKVFVLRNRVVSGLLPRLQRLLYPSYTWEEAVSLAAKKANKPRGKPVRQSEFHGLSNGKKLDKQVGHAIYFARIHGLDCSVFVSEKERLKATKKLPKSAATRLLQMSTRLALPAQNFFRMCAARGFRPLYSQTTVGCRVTPVATMVDVKCVDANGCVVLIENKVGYSEHARASTGPMRFPYQDQSDCAYNQHQVQLAATTLLHNMTFPAEKAVSSFVWRHDEEGVSQYPLEDWASDRISQVLSQMRVRVC